MDKKTLLTLLARETDMVWSALCELYPVLCRFDPPKLELNNRFWRTAGCCYQDANRVELGYKFFVSSPQNFSYMKRVILPHELIHQADYNIFGESDKPCGHGTNWRKIMVQYGLKPAAFHSMEITR